MLYHNAQNGDTGIDTPYNASCIAIYPVLQYIVYIATIGCIDLSDITYHRLQII